jgi:hypothetical protein
VSKGRATATSLAAHLRALQHAAKTSGVQLPEGCEVEVNLCYFDEFDEIDAESCEVYNSVSHEMSAGMAAEMAEKNDEAARDDEAATTPIKKKSKKGKGQAKGNKNNMLREAMIFLCIQGANRIFYDGREFMVIMQAISRSLQDVKSMKLPLLMRVLAAHTVAFTGRTGSVTQERNFGPTTVIQLGDFLELEVFVHQIQNEQGHRMPGVFQRDTDVGRKTTKRRWALKMKFLEALAKLIPAPGLTKLARPKSPVHPDGASACATFTQQTKAEMLAGFEEIQRDSTAPLVALERAVQKAVAKVSDGASAASSGSAAAPGKAVFANVHRYSTLPKAADIDEVSTAPQL